MKLICFAAFAAIAVASSAPAALVEVTRIINDPALTFSGPDNPRIPGYSPGDPLKYTFTYDADVFYEGVRYGGLTGELSLSIGEFAATTTGWVYLEVYGVYYIIPGFRSYFDEPAAFSGELATDTGTWDASTTGSGSIDFSILGGWSEGLFVTDFVTGAWEQLVAYESDIGFSYEFVDPVSGQSNRIQVRAQLLSADAVPEPSTYGLLGAAMAMGLIAIRRARNLSMSWKPSNASKISNKREPGVRGSFRGYRRDIPLPFDAIERIGSACWCGFAPHPASS